MIEIILALLEIVVEAIVFEEAIEVSWAWKPIAHAFRRSRLANPVLAGIGILVLGAAAGFLTAWLLPHRLLPMTSSLRGISLLVAPLCTGWIMHLFGRWRRQRGGDPSLLATFWGGALFAFAMATVRWVLVGRA
ncbi:MAG: hypothetical protein ABSE56_10785 [Bryobacteraceae bacterium]|jgi:hypothetical protein